MAKIVFTDAHIRLQDVTDASVAVKSQTFPLKTLSLETSQDAVDVTNFSPDENFSVFLDSLRSWTASGEFHSDHAAGQNDEVLWALVGKRIQIKLFPVKPASSSVDALAYTGHCVMTAFSPFSGTVGDASMGSFTLQGADELTRDAKSKDT